MGWGKLFAYSLRFDTMWLGSFRALARAVEMRWCGRSRVKQPARKMGGKELEAGTVNSYFKKTGFEREQRQGLAGA